MIATLTLDMNRYSMAWIVCVIGATIGCSAPDVVPGAAPNEQPTETTNDPSTAGETQPLAGRLIDLTHAFDENTIYWPTAKGFRMTEQSAGITPGGYFYAANAFALAEHGGTHIDAPIHFAEKHQTVDEIPLERLIGEAVVIDISDQCASDPDYQVSLEDLHAWEQLHQRQFVDVIVLLRTGYSKHWPNRKQYLGTNELGPDAVKKLHFPGLDPDAARWLAEHRAIKAIGIDTASIDYGQSRDFLAHRILFKHNIPALENVALLEELPAEGFTLIALPMKIRGGSGGPTRVVAIVPDD